MTCTLTPLRLATRLAKPAFPTRRWLSSQSLSSLSAERSAQTDRSIHPLQARPRRLAQPSASTSQVKSATKPHAASRPLLFADRQPRPPRPRALADGHPHPPLSTPPLALRHAQDGVLKQGERVLPQALEVMRILTGHNKKGIKYPFILVRCLLRSHPPSRRPTPPRAALSADLTGLAVHKRRRHARNRPRPQAHPRARNPSKHQARSRQPDPTDPDAPAEPRLASRAYSQIAEHQLVQSHTIFRSLVSKFGDKPVLVVGGRGDLCRQVAQSYGFNHAVGRPFLFLLRNASQAQVASSRCPESLTDLLEGVRWVCSTPQRTCSTGKNRCGRSRNRFRRS